MLVFVMRLHARNNNKMQLMFLYILFTLSYKSCSGGIYRKLQQVMQVEKERDVDSLKNVSAGTGPEGTCPRLNILLTT